MAWKDRNAFSFGRLLDSFSYAIQGLRHAVRTERNFQIHLTAALIVSMCGFAFRLNRMEWVFILICIFGMIALELLNSAIEKTVDLVTDEIKPLAKQAKDMAAGAVMVYAIMTVVIGLIIFIPKVFELFQ
ncbi:diacylglycerol kinase family protein [Siminovitchia terrae]|uniref:Diacylglycerol kinase family protein n=1 Tax=Siminovitchia terrae TaxID=1914933 RepID=A0A429XDD7_SIMTE|nr:diacylglycerol kinase family protein [Siminovitchia terrae]RST61476.1 diacylglycerol kinase family protein [Siminovitchia terrae]